MQMTLANHVFDDIDFDFLDGVHVCSEAEMERIPSALKTYFPVSDFGPYREWWNARETPEGVSYDYFDETMAKVTTKLEEGYDGLVGFSQGGAVAAAVLSKRPDLVGWAWFQSTFIPRQSGLTFPVVNFKGKVLATTHHDDPVVPADKLMDLAKAFSSDPTVIYFPGKAHKLVSLKDASSSHVQQVHTFFKNL